MVCPQKMSHEFGDMVETTQPYLCYLPDKVLSDETQEEGWREGGGPHQMSQIPGPALPGPWLWCEAARHSNCVLPVTPASCLLTVGPHTVVNHTSHTTPVTPVTPGTLLI